MEREYALYKGDELLGIGTIQELAEMRGVTYRGMSYFLTGAYKRKLEKRGNPWNVMALVSTEDEEEDLDDHADRK